MTMDPKQQREQFSLAVVKAIAAAAGVSWSQPSVDDDSVDIAFSSRVYGRPRLEAQVKCSSGEHLYDDGVHFSLKRKNHDDLRLVDVVIPRILIVVLVPQSVGEWLTMNEEQMVLRRCAWWSSLRSAPEILPAAAGSTTVVLPRGNRLDPPALAQLLPPRVAT